MTSLNLRIESLRALCDFSAARPEQICQPVRNGHRRHPVLLPKPLFLELAASRAQDLKNYLSGLQVAVCDVNDPGLDLDIDRPEDYKKALMLDSVA